MNSKIAEKNIREDVKMGINRFAPQLPFIRGESQRELYRHALVDFIDQGVRKQVLNFPNEFGERAVLELSLCSKAKILKDYENCSVLSDESYITVDARAELKFYNENGTLKISNQSNDCVSMQFPIMTIPAYGIEGIKIKDQLQTFTNLESPQKSFQIKTKDDKTFATFSTASGFNFDIRFDNRGGLKLVRTISRTKEKRSLDFYKLYLAMTDQNTLIRMSHDLGIVGTDYIKSIFNGDLEYQYSKEELSQFKFETIQFFQNSKLENYKESYLEDINNKFEKYVTLNKLFILDEITKTRLKSQYSLMNNIVGLTNAIDFAIGDKLFKIGHEFNEEDAYYLTEHGVTRVKVKADTEELDVVCNSVNERLDINLLLNGVNELIRYRLGICSTDVDSLTSKRYLTAYHWLKNYMESNFDSCIKDLEKNVVLDVEGDVTTCHFKEDYRPKINLIVDNDYKAEDGLLIPMNFRNSVSAIEPDYTINGVGKNHSKKQRYAYLDRAGFICPVSSPESEKTGVTQRLVLGASININGVPQNTFYPVKNGKIKISEPKLLTPADLVNKVWATDFREVQEKKSDVECLFNEKFCTRDYTEVEYVLWAPRAVISRQTQIGNCVTSDKERRCQMVGNHNTQFLHCEGSTRHKVTEGVSNLYSDLCIRVPHIVRQARPELYYSKDKQKEFEEVCKAGIKVVSVPSKNVSRGRFQFRLLHEDYSNDIVQQVHSVNDNIEQHSWKYGVNNFSSGTTLNFEEIKDNIYRENDIVLKPNDFDTTPVKVINDEVPNIGVTNNEGWIKLIEEGDLANGAPVFVAICREDDYNYEDAVKVSRSLIESGKFNHIQSYSFKKNLIESNKGKRDEHKTIRLTSPPNGDERFDSRHLPKIGTKFQSGEKILYTETQKYLPAEGNSSQLVADGDSIIDELIVPEGYSGVVTSVDKSQNRKGETMIRIVVERTMIYDRGDKITGGHGNKGTCALIQEDDEMLQYKDPVTGEYIPIDIVLDGHGIAPRMNIGQLNEMALYAYYMGERKSESEVLLVDSFDKTTMGEFIKKGLENPNLGLTQLYRKIDGEIIPVNGLINVGYMYFQKLDHCAEKKIIGTCVSKSRDEKTDQPAKNEIDKPQKTSELFVKSIQSNGAFHILEQIKSVGSGDYKATKMAINKIKTTGKMAINKIKTTGQSNIKSDHSNPIEAKYVMMLAMGVKFNKDGSCNMLTNKDIGDISTQYNYDKFTNSLIEEILYEKQFNNDEKGRPSKYRATSLNTRNVYWLNPFIFNGDIIKIYTYRKLKKRAKIELDKLAMFEQQSSEIELNNLDFNNINDLMMYQNRLGLKTLDKYSSIEDSKFEIKSFSSDIVEKIMNGDVYVKSIGDGDKKFILLVPKEEADKDFKTGMVGLTQVLCSLSLEDYQRELELQLNKELEKTDEDNAQTYCSEIESSRIIQEIREKQKQLDIVGEPRRYLINNFLLIPYKYRTRNVSLRTDDDTNKYYRTIMSKCLSNLELSKSMKDFGEWSDSDYNTYIEYSPVFSKFYNRFMKLQIEFTSKDEMTLGNGRNDKPIITPLKRLKDKETGLTRSKIASFRTNWSARSVITPEMKNDMFHVSIPQPLIAKVLEYHIYYWMKEYSGVLDFEIYTKQEPISIDEFPEKLTTDNDKYNIRHPELFTAFYELLTNEQDFKDWLNDFGHYNEDLFTKPYFGKNTKLQVQTDKQKSAALYKEILDFIQDKIKDKPVIVCREPALLRTNTMAFYPIITQGNSIGLSPLVCPAFNSDFDGDQMSVIFPIGEDCWSEAREKMMSDKAIISDIDGTISFVLKKGMVGGLYRATHYVDEETPIVEYSSYDDFVKDIKSTKLPANRRVHLVTNLDNFVPIDLTSTAGRLYTNLQLRRFGGISLVFNQEEQLFAWQQKYQEELINNPYILKCNNRTYDCTNPLLTDYNNIDLQSPIIELYHDGAWNKKKDMEIAKQLIDNPKEVCYCLDTLRFISNDLSKNFPTTLSLEDFNLNHIIEDVKVEDNISDELKILEQCGLISVSKDKDKLKSKEVITKKLNTIKNRNLQNNNFIDMIESGACGSYSNLQNLIMGEVYIKDCEGKSVVRPVKGSYLKGVNSNDMLVSGNVVRASQLSTSEETKKSGELQRDLTYALADVIVEELDCGATPKDYKLIKELDESSLSELKLHKGWTIVDTGLTNDVGTTTGELKLNDVRIEYISENPEFKTIQLKYEDGLTEKIDLVYKVKDMNYKFLQGHFGLDKSGKLVQFNQQNLKEITKDSDTVKVRLMYDCKRKHGVCAKCAGTYNTQTKSAKLPESLSTKCSEAIGNTLVQLNLDKKNSVGDSVDSSAITAEIMSILKGSKAANNKEKSAKDNTRVLSLYMGKTLHPDKDVCMYIIKTGTDFCTTNLTGTNEIIRTDNLLVANGKKVKCGQKLIAGKDKFSVILERTQDVSLTRNLMLNYFTELYSSNSIDINYRYFEILIKVLTDKIKMLHTVNDNYRVGDIKKAYLVEEDNLKEDSYMHIFSGMEVNDLYNGTSSGMFSTNTKARICKGLKNGLTDDFEILTCCINGGVNLIDFAEYIQNPDNKRKPEGFNPNLIYDTMVKNSETKYDEDFEEMKILKKKM